MMERESGSSHFFLSSFPHLCPSDLTNPIITWLPLTQRDQRDHCQLPWGGEEGTAAGEGGVQLLPHRHHQQSLLQLPTFPPQPSWSLMILIHSQLTHVQCPPLLPPQPSWSLMILILPQLVHVQYPPLLMRSSEIWLLFKPSKVGTNGMRMKNGRTPKKPRTSTKKHSENSIK